MSIVSVDNIQPIGSGTSVTVNSAATLVLNNANSTGVITATTFVGNLTGNPTGTLQTAAQPNITSVGTLSGLTVAGNVNCTSGRFQRGSATIQDGDAIAGGININGLDMDASVIMSVFGNDGDFTRISGSKSRNASVGSHTIVQDNDVLLSLKGFGSDGTNFEEAAQIEMQVDGTPNNNVMPGRIVFKTATTDGVAERVRITSAGLVGINTDSPSAAWLDIASDSGSYDHLRLRRLSSDSNVASNWSLKPYGGNLYFRTGGSTDKIYFDDSGDLNIMDGNLIIGTSGHGIDFSATSDHGSATPASELLDDYEEGSWTPVLESTSTNPTISSYSKQQGLYTKIGNVVHLFCFIDIAAGNIGGTLTGDGKITGLPFVISNNPSSTDIHGSACDNLKSIPNTFSSQRNNAMLYFPPGQDYLAIHQYSTTNPIYQTGWGMSQIGNGNRFKWAWTGQYRTDQI